MSGAGRDHLEALKADAGRAPVVLFASRITDCRQLVTRLSELAIPHRVVELSMAEPAMRERFHVLEEWTGWGTLPQVFMDGRFIGGPQELLAHERLQGGVPRTGYWLGWAGVLPFAFCLAGYLLSEGETRASFAHAFVAYGAVILSFVGAVHWGVVLGRASGPGGALRVAVSVVPALAAWLALSLPVGAAAWTLFVTFVLFRAWESRAGVAAPLPPWYRHLRTGLTLAVGALLLVFALAAN